MKLLDFLLDLLYPPRCAFCRRLVPAKQRGLCRSCGGKLPYVPADGQRQQFRNLENCLSPLFYDGLVRESLHRYKFGGLTAYSEIYSDFLAKCIDENQISCDIITWVPLSRKRLRKRGYDQAELLARGTAKRLGVECVPLLNKTRDNPPQSQTGSAKKRRVNAAGCYQCAKPALTEGKRILLIDDIVTTGATLSECAGVLKGAGAAEINAATLARNLR